MLLSKCCDAEVIGKGYSTEYDSEYLNYCPECEQCVEGLNMTYEPEGE